jgi:hypothetical protein
MPCNTIQSMNSSHHISVLILNVFMILQGKIRVDKSAPSRESNSDPFEDDLAPHDGSVNALVIDSRTRYLMAVIVMRMFYFILFSFLSYPSCPFYFSIASFLSLCPLCFPPVLSFPSYPNLFHYASLLSSLDIFYQETVWGKYLYGVPTLPDGTNCLDD